MIPEKTSHHISFKTLLLIIAAAAGVSYAVWAATEEPQPSPADIRITSAEGEVDVLFKGDEAWVPAEADTPIDVGDSVRTGEGSQAEISFGGQSIYELQEKALFALSEAGEKKQAFELSVGTLLLHIRKLLAGQTVEVRTKAALTAIHGTDLGIEAREDGISSIGVFDGEVAVTGQGMPGVPGREFKVSKEQEMKLRYGVKPEEPKPLKEFLAHRERMKALFARRIVLRRDWQPMPKEKREELRKMLREQREKRVEARRERLKKAREAVKEKKEQKKDIKEPERRKGVREKGRPAGKKTRKAGRKLPAKR